MPLWKKNLWILWTTQVISLMSFGFGLPFIPLYIEEIQVLTPEQVKLFTTILAAVPAITMGIMAPIWGSLADRHGRKLMIIRAMFSAVLVLFAMGLVTNVYQLIGLRLLQGLLTGTVTAAMTFVGSNTPKDHLTSAIGILGSSTFIGYSIGPVIGGFFADAFGYRMSFFLGSVIMIIGGLLVLVFVKEDKSTLKSKDEPKEKVYKNLKKILAPIIIYAMVMLFVLRISRTIFSPYVALFIKTKLPEDQVVRASGILMGCIGFATAAASMMVGRIITRFSKIRVLKTLLFSGLAVIIIMLQHKMISEVLQINSFYVFAFLYVLFFIVIGGVEPIVSSTAASVVSVENRGILFGLQGMIGSLAWFVAPTIAGPLVYDNPVEIVLYIIPITLTIGIFASYKLNKHLDSA